jgi:hypothetical protein
MDDHLFVKVRFALVKGDLTPLAEAIKNQRLDAVQPNLEILASMILDDGTTDYRIETVRASHHGRGKNKTLFERGKASAELNWVAKAAISKGILESGVSAEGVFYAIAGEIGDGAINSKAPHERVRKMWERWVIQSQKKWELEKDIYAQGEGIGPDVVMRLFDQEQAPDEYLVERAKHSFGEQKPTPKIKKLKS